MWRQNLIGYKASIVWLEAFLCWESQLVSMEIYFFNVQSSNINYTQGLGSGSVALLRFGISETSDGFFLLDEYPIPAEDPLHTASTYLLCISSRK